MSSPNPIDEAADDSSHSVSSPGPKVFPQRIEKNDVDDAVSNASSTDDLVRELLDPDDRPKNVWHVVEKPKSDDLPADDATPDGEQRAPSDEFPAHPEGNHDHHEPHKEVEADREPSDAGAAKPAESRDVDESRRDRHRERESSRKDDRHRSRRERSGDRSSSSRQRHQRDKEHRHRSGRDRDRERDRDRSKDRHRSHRLRDISDDEGTGDHGRHKSTHRSHRRSSSRTSSRRRERSRSYSPSPVTKRNSRTILIMQLNPRVTSQDLEDFFSEAGKVREVRLIMDSKTRRHKGIAYIEFEDTVSAQKAFAMNGQKFFGAPIVIQSASSDREKGRSSGDWQTSSSHSGHHSTSHISSRSHHLPPNSYRVYVGSLNVNLTEDMLRSVFEPFGTILRLELMRDRTTGVSRGYAFITYANIDDGQLAVQSLDGLELGCKAIKVSKSNDKGERHGTTDGHSALGRGGHHDGESDFRSDRNKDVTASLYELAGH